MKPLVLQMSGTYVEERFTDWLLGVADGAQIVDLSGVDGTSCYCDDAAREVIESALPASLPGLRWLDSGDYHYLTHILALREKEPFSLVLLDNHPDDKEPAFDGMLSCGGWVKAMKEENPMLEDVLTIGPEGCPRGIPEGWGGARRLYISLDKDIMGRKWARTDWSQGAYSLHEVKDMLGKLFNMARIAAIDICGELSPSKGATAEDLTINFETNKELYNYITKHLN